ncbi:MULTISPECIES: hypothetical protein [Cyanophyceae]|nr:hypothetical protein [Coleofasciculus sp. FACHB-125]
MTKQGTLLRDRALLLFPRATDGYEYSVSGELANLFLYLFLHFSL